MAAACPSCLAVKGKEGQTGYKWGLLFWPPPTKRCFTPARPFETFGLNDLTKSRVQISDPLMRMQVRLVVYPWQGRAPAFSTNS